MSCGGPFLVPVQHGGHPFLVVGSHGGRHRADGHGRRLVPGLERLAQTVEQRHLAEEVHPGQEGRRVGDRPHAGVPHQAVEAAATELDGPRYRFLATLRRAEVGDDLGVAQVDADHLHAVLFSLPPGGRPQT